MKKIYILGLFALSFAACKPDLKTQAPTAGTANFSKYLAVGNSLTAGYADNSLYRTGQLNSYPLRLSEQFALVGGGSFVQPLMPGDAGYPGPKLVLKFHFGCDLNTSLSPLPFSGTFDTAGSLNNIAAQGPFNNLGVPGIRCIDYLTPGYAYFAYVLGQSPYAFRFYKDPVNERPLDEILAQQPTFFTCWLGSNDVLGYATGGGQGPIGVVPPAGSPTGISDPATFQVCYDSIVAALTRNNAKGALINVPDIAAIPFFTTIPANGLVLRPSQADSLNLFWLAQGVTNLHFTAGPNYFLVTDHGGNPRQATAGELILLSTPQDSLTCAGWGSIQPIPNQYVLTADEVANIQTYTSTFNSIIKAAAAAHGLAYVDMYSFLHTVSSGLIFNGVGYNAQFVTGGAFSLDGVHLTPRGYALVANHILGAVNTTYKSTLPAIDINKYSGVLFPNEKQ